MARGKRIATTIVGTGKLARSLAPLLDRAGYPVTAIVGRTRRAAAALCSRTRRAQPTTSPRVGAERGELILIAVSDRAIETVARKLAEARGIDWSGRTVMHHAGALGPEPLARLAAGGASVGVMHPLQSLGTPRLAAEILPGSRARVEGDRAGAAAARKLARALGLVPLAFPELSDDDRTAYHAAASLLSNDLLALLTIGRELLESAGLAGDEALAALLPLARGTLRQVEAGGVGGPLTGPAARGDVETLRRHLERLRADSPQAAEAHRLLSLRLARLALELGESSAARTKRAFGGRSRGAEV
jgi:predicted short-subunit dehydrogenase-like oxidoreductase (DUF2520 family)